MRNENAELCRVYGVVTTAYMDDIVFSGRRAREPIEPTALALRNNGFRISRRKTRVMGADDTKIVTNLDVTTTLRAPQRYVDELEEAILTFARHGRIPERDHLSILGKIRHVKRLSAVQAAPLEELLATLPVGGTPLGSKTRARRDPPCGRYRYGLWNCHSGFGEGVPLPIALPRCQTWFGGVGLGY